MEQYQCSNFEQNWSSGKGKGNTQWLMVPVENVISEWFENVHDVVPQNGILNCISKIKLVQHKFY